mgnify:CR=1 FL=1
MIKKLVTITALAMLLVSPVSYAKSWHSGNTLLEACERDDASFREGVCYGYVYGVVDVLSGEQFCAPSNVTASQFVNIVIKYLKQNPENLHYNAAVLVAFALAQVFPCSE